MSISADSRLEESQADSVAKQAAAAIRKRYGREREREGEGRNISDQDSISYSRMD